MPTSRDSNLVIGPNHGNERNRSTSINQSDQVVNDWENKNGSSLSLDDADESNPILVDKSDSDDSFSDVEAQVKKRSRFAIIKDFLWFMGPAVLISVGYVDPGNWESDISGGTYYGYKLLWVLVLSNFLAIILQTLSARLGLVTGLDLAQACRMYYHPGVSFTLWILAEVAIIATDLAEVLGTAIGLKVLFGLPMIWGVLITGLDTLAFLVLEKFGHRFMEIVVFGLMAIISGCFVLEMIFSKPDIVEVISGSLVPRLPPGSLQVATAILGATIMPHNLYLHSGIIISRRSEKKEQTQRNCWFALLDGLLSLNVAMFVNGSILVLAAAAFYGKTVKPDEDELITSAYQLLNGLFGKGKAPQIMFGIALLCAGQSSTITGTIAGQIVMEGFIDIRLKPWIRRLITRTMAIVPAVAVLLYPYIKTGKLGSGGALLLWSQIVLSIQLPFAIIPLIRITSHPIMGDFKTRWYAQIVAWVAVLIVIALNVWLLVDAMHSLGWYTADRLWLWIISIIIGMIILVFVLYICFCQLVERKQTKLKVIERFEKKILKKFWFLKYLLKADESEKQDQSDQDSNDMERSSESDSLLKKDVAG